jgi:hypothetical protein
VDRPPSNPDGPPAAEGDAADASGHDADDAGRTGEKAVLLGEIAVELKFVSRADLDRVLEERAKGSPMVGIGETLVFKKCITPRQLEVLLGEQARRLGAEGDRLFGQIAIDLGIVSSRAVKGALEEQKARTARGLHSPVGMILVERGLLSTADVERVLSIQVEKTLEITEDEDEEAP